MNALNPAERYAALKLLEASLRVALDTAKTEADEYRRTVGAKSLTSAYGDVIAAKRKPGIVFDDDGLIGWCVDEMPNLVQRHIPVESRRWLADKRFQIVGGDVIDPTTGEVVPFAHVSAPSEYLTWRATTEVKQEAVTALAARLEGITAAMLPPAPESDAA